MQEINRTKISDSVKEILYKLEDNSSPHFGAYADKQDDITFT